MRHRLEDLGRLAVMIDNLLEHKLFEDYDLRPGRPKDYGEWFASKTEDQKDDIIHAWVYGLESIRDKLYDMLSIAQGTDLLNDSKMDG
ncbi:MAG: hypothetical protein JSR46_02895 [Verrucomicrobia bacterium]|nr:hypothetical protein [Verrucomicrobiota bacterium]